MLRLISYFMIFVLGALLGSAFPSYSSQYQQRLTAQLNQVRVDLAPFQEIANEFHRGSLPDLIEHHLKSDDSTFHAEGLAIQMMLESEYDLEMAHVALNAPPLYQARFFLENIDYELARSTWQGYTPSIVTTPDALKFSMAVGVGLSLLSYLLWASIRFFARWVYNAQYR
jgi:hypothetical protein